MSSHSAASLQQKVRVTEIFTALVREVFYFPFALLSPLRSAACQMEMASENITETITGRKYGSPVVAWLNSTSVRNGGGIVSPPCISLIELYLDTAQSTWAERLLNGIGPFQPHCRTAREIFSEILSRARRHPLLLIRLKLHVEIVEWQNREQRWCRVGARGCSWDTRSHCWARWRLCGHNLLKAAMMWGFSLFIAVLTTLIWATLAFSLSLISITSLITGQNDCVRVLLMPMFLSRGALIMMFMIRLHLLLLQSISPVPHKKKF